MDTLVYFKRNPLKIDSIYQAITSSIKQLPRVFYVNT